MAKSRRRRKGDDWRRELLDDVTGLASDETNRKRPCRQFQARQDE
jgi:hypothetical protein